MEMLSGPLLHMFSTLFLALPQTKKDENRSFSRIKLKISVTNGSTNSSKFSGDICDVIGSTTATISTPASDRKSTRLNSSHVRISYAVFCLKKKKQKTQKTKHKSQ